MSLLENQSHLSQSGSLQNVKIARSQGGTFHGQLMKGWVNEAHMKTVTGSIPSKFETIVAKSNPKKSFNSTSRRFFQKKDEKNLYMNQGIQNQVNQNQNTPGPGYYETQSDMGKSGMSFSKKGANGFISGTQRNPFKCKYDNNGPGPGSYDNLSGISTTFTNIQNSNSQLVQNDFKKQVYPFNSVSRGNNEKKKQMKPGPGQYDPQFPRTELGGRNAFWSKELRLKDVANMVPGVGQYQIRQNIGKEVFQNKAKDTNTNVDLINTINHRYLNKISKKGIENAKKLVGFIDNKIDEQQLAEDSKLTKSQPQHMFRYSSVDRFGDLETKIQEIKDIPEQKRFNNLNILKEMRRRLPNPATYELNQLDKERQKKQYVSGSSFMSESIRLPYGCYGQKLGPNMKQTQQFRTKKSYHLNLACRWVQ